MEKTFSYKISELESSLSKCVKSGITELSVHDSAVAEDKGKLLRFLMFPEKLLSFLYPFWLILKIWMLMFAKLVKILIVP